MAVAERTRRTRGWLANRPLAFSATPVCLQQVSLPLPGTEYFYCHRCNILVLPSLFSSHLFPAAELSGTSEGLMT